MSESDVKVRRQKAWVFLQQERMKQTLRFVPGNTWLMSNLQAIVNMPELYLDPDWNVVGYSMRFLSVTRRIAEFAERKLNASLLFNPEDWNNICNYLERVDRLEKSDFSGGRWRLRYRGPDPEREVIGRDWIDFSTCRSHLWEIKPLPDGRPALCHHPHLEDFNDCHLVTAAEFGGPEEDVQVIYRIRTPDSEEMIRDLSLVLSSGSGREGVLPDSLGYTLTSGSNYNIESGIQRQTAKMISQMESLLPSTDYEITARRIGGRLSRECINLATGERSVPLEYVDSNAIYDSNNHVGFITYSGGACFYDIRIYTRKSRFLIEDFRIPFDIEAGLNIPGFEDRRYKLRIGNDYSTGRRLVILMFEDITERCRMERHLERYREQLRSLSTHLQTVREKERAEIAREIHDDLGQVLTALKLDLAWIGLKTDSKNTRLKEKIHGMNVSIDKAIESVQRISRELRPGLLDELGLVAAMEWEASRFAERTGIHCGVIFPPEETAFSWSVATALFRIFQEALTNISRHSGASRAWVRLEIVDGSAVLLIRDNGCGIDPEKLNDSKSLGLIGMHERVRDLQGSIEIRGEAERGTELEVHLPLGDEGE